ncbi:hypothetical protein C4553_03375 [Candidatus Parcubacteria bacterium]|nr:MAG: hypothetical protein C4553_03375 [Candidatus Parcubacteria bacterium]
MNRLERLRVALTIGAVIGVVGMLATEKLWPKANVSWIFALALGIFGITISFIALRMMLKSARQPKRNQNIKSWSVSAKR